MANNSKTYTVQDVEAAEAKILRLGGPAIDFTRPTGEVTAHGCTLAWTIAPAAASEAAKDVTVTVTSKPFYVGYGAIFNELATLFNGAA